MLSVHSQVSIRNVPTQTTVEWQPMCVCVWWEHGSGGRLNGAGVSLRPSLLRIHREDIVGGTTAALLSKGCLEVVLVFGRGGTRRGQTDMDTAQQPEGPGPAVREPWNLMPEQSLVASVYRKMKPLPAARNLSSFLSKRKLFNSLLSKSW